jgi:hypothetical protein
MPAWHDQKQLCFTLYYIPRFFIYQTIISHTIVWMNPSVTNTESTLQYILPAAGLSAFLHCRTELSLRVGRKI